MLYSIWRLESDQINCLGIVMEKAICRWFGSDEKNRFVIVTFKSNTASEFQSFPSLMILH